MTPEEKYYVLKDDDQLGPFSLQTISNLISSGELSRYHLFAENGAEQWRPVGELYPEDKYYVLTDAKQIGPFNKSTIRDMLMTGEVTKKDKLRHELNPSWIGIPEIFPDVGTSQGSIHNKDSTTTESDQTFLIGFVLSACIFLVAIVAVAGASGDSNGVEVLASIIGLCVGGLVYFIPSYVAHTNKHRNFQAILVLNLLLGWTFFGWVIAIVWAVSKEKK